MATRPAAPRRHPRERLAALRAPAGVSLPSPDGSDGSDGSDSSDSSGGSGGEPPPIEGSPVAGEPATPRRVEAPVASALRGASGRLVRRWLPAGAGQWRLDPGRRGALLLAAVVLLAAAVAAVAVWRSRPVVEPAPTLAAVEISSTAQPGGTELVVSVAGQVVHPGLVRLAPGARVADAIEAAGGPAPGTDMTGVNLARRLTDGEHVVVGPAATPESAAGQAPSSGSGARVSLSTATLAELDALPGIGPVTAQRIVDWRSAHGGRFASVDQLREVDGIGEARFVRLRDLVTA